MITVPKPRKLNSGNYFIQLRLKGKSYSVTADTERECIAKAEAIKARYGSSKEEVTVYPTLSQGIDFYIDDRSAVLSPATIRGYRTIQKNYFQDIMNVRLDSIKNLQTYINKEAKCYSSKTIKNACGLISAVYKDNGLPVPKMRLPQVVKKERPYLKPDEVLRLIECAKGSKCELAVLLGLHSLRRSEMLALRKEDIRDGYIDVHGSAVFDENSQFVFKETNKNETSRRKVPILIPRLQELIDELPEGLIFNCNPETLSAQVKRLCRKNGITEVSCHGLRHSFASLAVHLGIPERVAMTIGGWADRNTMHRIYVHILDEDVAQGADALKSFFSNFESDC